MTSSTPLFGLPEKTLSSLRSIFSKYSPIERVILYGSRAKGNYREGSDIDLTLIAPTMTLSDLLRIQNEIDDAMLAHKVDLSLYHQIENEDLKEHITRVGKDFLNEC